MSIILIAYSAAIYIITMTMNAKPKLQLIFFYGKGGSGKDTQARNMYKDHPGWIGISTGDEIKGALRNPEHKYHHAVAPFMHYIEEGRYLPDETVINIDSPRDAIYTEFVEEQIALGAEAIISTGCPRTISQLDLIDQYATTLGERFNVTTTHIYLKVQDDTSRARAAKRMAEDIANKKEPRKDDKPESVEKRLREFSTLTIPMLEKLNSEGRLITIPADGTPEQVNELVNAELRKALEFKNEIEGRPAGVERF